MTTKRFSYHGRWMPDWQAYAMPDQMPVCDHVDPAAEPLGTLIIRRRTEAFVPVPPSIHRLGRVA